MRQVCYYENRCWWFINKMLLRYFLLIYIKYRWTGPIYHSVKCSMHSIVWSRNVISQRLFCYSQKTGVFFVLKYRAFAPILFPPSGVFKSIFWPHVGEFFPRNVKCPTKVGMCTCEIDWGINFGYFTSWSCFVYLCIALISKH